MASEVFLLSSFPPPLSKPRSSLPSPSPSPSPSTSAAASRVCSPPIRILRRRHARKALVRRPRAADQPGQVQDDEVVDSKILPYCSIDKKKEKTVGELEQEFLQALQAFYYDKKAIMSNEEFDNLKEELMWEGSSVVMLSPDEQKLLEASMAYVAGKPIMTDAEFDELKMRLKKEGSDIVQEGPRCSLRSRKVYSDLSVDYFKMFLLNVPAAVVALGLFFFLDDLTGFEITYLLELPEPFSFIFTWFAALPLIFWLAQTITSAILKDFLILKGPCPNCGTENLSFFGTILSVSSGGSTNTVKCSNSNNPKHLFVSCGTELVYDSKTRLITLPEP
ncbi:PGR5-like protein 1A, chloroplastic, partial [Ananas comosus]